MKLTDAQIATVMKSTGATKEYVLAIAKNVPERINIWFPGRIALSTWACLRSTLIIGPARKVFWTIVCTVLQHPVVGIIK